ncbi:MAG: CbtB-domain containing protein [Gammaproteobacteria bacterium]|nr:CbtB-domain containing protein [Gammaproteobacteria bacterium]
MATQATPSYRQDDNSPVTEASQASSRRAVLLQNIAALAFGAVILFAVGFLPLSAAHNAAHDTRHTVAFPCH